MEFKSYIAEFIATFTLIFVGAGSVLANDVSEGLIGYTGIAFAHGLAIMTMVYAIGHVSGGHINPAVTIGMWITKKIKSIDAIFYMIFQLGGAVAAGFALQQIFITVSPDLKLGTPALIEGMTLFGGILVEAILTFFLMFVIFGTVIDKKAPKGFYGLAIGLTVTLDIFVGGVLTGAAMNPARAFGPAFVSNFWTNQIVYWIGPIIGAVLGALVYSNLIMKKK